ncbi:hypothetical protein J3459_010825 [Metarhizium acridum]|uniref:uncharacterized protein n=1 Tax=Metarhizium acridum TaxID=92637 RepID=UPI001C6ABE56|nr:hypothetical protein J3458_019864 [Metarhizium acridum]KAG8421986.1 hypothetical protein J3459_010825 [Metarhizium acridum]
MTLSHPSKTDRILVILADFAGLFVSVKPFLNVPFPKRRQVQRSSNMIRNVPRNVIQVKKQKLEREQLDDVDIVSVALRSGVFSEDEVIDQMMTFPGAGHENDRVGADVGDLRHVSVSRHPEPSP